MLQILSISVFIDVKIGELCYSHQQLQVKVQWMMIKTLNILICNLKHIIMDWYTHYVSII